MLKPGRVVKQGSWGFGRLLSRTAKQSKNQVLAEVRWKAQTKDGDSPVGENSWSASKVPKYRGTRGILREFGRTTFQD